VSNRAILDTLALIAAANRGKLFKCPTWPSCTAMTNANCVQNCPNAQSTKPFCVSPVHTVQMDHVVNNSLTNYCTLHAARQPSDTVQNETSNKITINKMSAITTELRCLSVSMYRQK